MNKTGKWLGIAVAAVALMGVGCESSNKGADDGTGSATDTSAVAAKPKVAKADYSKSAIPRWAEVEREGFKTFPTEEGRYWVFAEGSEGLEEFEATGEPGKNFTLIGRGPDGATLRSDSKTAVLEYLVAKPGYYVDIDDDGRLWVFLEGSKAHEEYLSDGELGKSVTLIGKGPNGMTIRSGDRETITGYRYSTPYYHVRQDKDGILWVVRAATKSYEEFAKHGEFVKSVTLFGKGPKGETMRSDDREVIMGYVASKPGWHVTYHDGRMLIFKTGTEDVHEFIHTGEPAKSMTMFNKGPNGETVRGPSREVLMEYFGG